MWTTVPTDRLTLARLPWATFAIALLWLGGALYTALGGTPLALSLDAFRVQDLLGHWVFSEGGAQVAVSIALLWCLGPPLEEAWGRPFFASFVTTMAVYTAGAYIAFAPESTRPLVGGGGVLAATLGACIGRHWRHGIDYRVLAWLGEPREWQLQVPAWALPGAWFLGEVVMQLGESAVGPTRGLTYAGQGAGFALGAAVGLGLVHFDLERTWLGRRPADAPDLAVENARALVRSGSAGAALREVAPLAARRPQDPEAVGALCEAAVAAGEPAAATGPFVTCVSHHLRSGEAAVAARLWQAFGEKLGQPQVDARLMLSLAEALAARQAKVPAARLLRGLLDAPGRLSTGMALRIVEIARPVHAGIAIRAATLALEGGDFPEAKRTRLEGIVRELERQRADALDPELDGAAEVRAGTDRSIAISLDDDDPSVPPPGLPTQPSIPVASEPEPERALFGSSEEMDLAGPDADADDLDAWGTGVAASQPRFQDTKCVEAVPVAWEGRRLSLRQGSASPAWLDLSQVQGLAAAAVDGLASRPVVLIDLLLNWREVSDAPLRILRLRSDRFDPSQLLQGDLGGLDGFRALLELLLEGSGADPLPDADHARGRPFVRFDDLASYEREVLSIER